MAYADLTTEQQSVLTAFDLLIRGWCSEQARISAKGSDINADYNNRIQTILAELQDADVIPNMSGLSGAESLTKSELITLVSYLQNILSYNSAAHRANMAKACGIENLLPR